MAGDKSPTSEKFRVYGRFAFLRLDKPKKFDDNGEDRWEATALLDPADAEGLKSIKLAISMAATVSKEAYGVVPLALKHLAAKFVPGQKAPEATAKDDGIEIAFYSGDKKDYDGYPGMFVIPAHNSKMKPAVANRRGVSVEPGEDQYPYSGAYGWTSITCWAQVGATQKKYGKRIGVNLRGCQFVKDGEAFGLGDIAPEEEFDALEDEGVEETGGMDFDD
jgi:Protein of unknown function (DUF2815)